MTLGSTIRDAREAARISLESLSDSTSIRMGLLTEIEDNNFKHCGGDTYARGHLRNIANRIGLNPQILLDLYDDQHSTEKRAMQDLLVENNIMQVPRDGSLRHCICADYYLKSKFFTSSCSNCLFEQECSTSTDAKSECRNN